MGRGRKRKGAEYVPKDWIEPRARKVRQPNPQVVQDLPQVPLLGDDRQRQDINVDRPRDEVI